VLSISEGVDRNRKYDDVTAGGGTEESFEAVSQDRLRLTVCNYTEPNPLLFLAVNAAGESHSISLHCHHPICCHQHAQIKR